MPEETKKRYYKIEVGDKIKIKRQTFEEYVFYKVSLSKKNADGTIAYFDKNIAFNSGVNVKDGATILVKDFFEDVFVRKNDKYNANWTIHITDFEEVEEQVSTNDAISEYNNKINGVDFTDVAPIIHDEDLPF